MPCSISRFAASLTAVVIFAPLLMAAPERGMVDAPAAVPEVGILQRSEAEARLERAMLTRRPALVVFGLEGCSWCERLERETLADPAVQDRLAGFDVVRADVLDEEELAAKHSVRGAPALVLFSPDGEVRGRVVGFVDARRMLTFLQRLEPAELAEKPSPAPGITELSESTRRLRDLPGDQVTLEDLTAALQELRDEKQAQSTREILSAKTDLPAGSLLALLEHPLLAVRLGAIEMLENRAGTDLGYDPWAVDPSVRADHLARWRAWLDQPVRVEAETDWQDPDVAAGLLNDLISGEPARVERGRRRIVSGGVPAAAAVADYERRNPRLAPDTLALLREVQLAAELEAADFPDARSLARRLAQGSLDQRLAALSTISSVWRGADRETELRIARSFLESPEPLEREAAVDAIARLAGDSTVDILSGQLRIETDDNVRHGLLRKLGGSGNAKAVPLLASWTAAENEDLAIVALESLGRFHVKQHPGVRDPILAALEDPRWRVRAAGLKAVQDSKLEKTASHLERMLGDPDEFVRIAAIQTVSERKELGTEHKLEAMFLENESLRAAISEAFVRMEKRLTPPMLEAVRTGRDDVTFAIISSLPDADAAAMGLLDIGVQHPNKDIRMAALRLMAANGMEFAENQVTLAAALRTLDEPSVAALISALAPPRSLRNSGESGEFAALIAAGASLWENAKSDLSRRSAALLLYMLGDARGAEFLTSVYESLSAAEQKKIAEYAGRASGPAADALFLRSLGSNDPAVRRSVLSSLVFQMSLARGRMVLDEVTRDGAELKAWDVPLYCLNPVRLDGNDQLVWREALEQMASNTSRPDLQVLALAALADSHSFGSSKPLVPEDLLTSTVPEVRAAARLLLALGDAESFSRIAEETASDPSPVVRQVAAFGAGSGNLEWKFRFPGHPQTRSESLHRSSPPVSLNAPERERLQRLERDPAPEVREMASLALVSRGEPFEVANLAGYLREKASNDYAVLSLVAPVFSSKLSGLPESYRIFVPFFRNSELSQHQRLVPQIEQRFPEETSATGEVVAAETPEPPAAPRAARPPSTEPEVVRLVYFSKPGCHHCDQVAAMLARLRESFPGIEVKEWNINKNSSMELNEVLSEKFGVPDNLRLVAPSVFAAGGFLVRDDVNESRLGQLVIDSRGEDDTILRADDEGLEGGAEAIGRRYAQIHWGVIVMAGLLDGLNPCAFATIIFLLSYLQVARKTPREILQIGVAYIAGVFLTYFILGLGLTEVLARAVLLQWLSSALNWSMGIFALVVAVLSARDGFRCLQGRMADMTLQLPEAVKTRIHGVIRTTARHRQFVVMAFAVGAFISILELACTGQVYAPTLLYMMQAGEGRALGYLALYNGAFVLPLSVVFGLAFFGLTSAALLAFFKRHAAWVKFSMAALFLTLGLLLVLREWN